MYNSLKKLHDLLQDINEVERYLFHVKGEDGLSTGVSLKNFKPGNSGRIPSSLLRWKVIYIFF